MLHFLDTYRRTCDEKYLEQIKKIYRKKNISLLSCWQIIERLRQIPHMEIEKEIPKEGKILDIGTGRGGFALYIALKSNKRVVYGIDTDSKRLADAINIKNELDNLIFLERDLDDVIGNNEKFDVILIMDILHHNKYSEQEVIIEKFNSILKDSGLVIMLEPGDYPFYRHYGIWFIDFILYPFSDTCKYRVAREWIDLFVKYKFENLSVKHITDRGLFFTRKIMVFQKK